jgi:hypothetical protein
VKRYCVEDTTMNGDSGAAVDFSTSYLLVVAHVGFASQGPLLSVGSEVWVRVDGGGGCGGANPGTEISFYVVPNGTEVKSQICSTSCTCTGGPCDYPP